MLCCACRSTAGGQNILTLLHSANGLWWSRHVCWRVSEERGRTTTLATRERARILGAPRRFGMRHPHISSYHAAYSQDRVRVLTSRHHAMHRCLEPGCCMSNTNALDATFGRGAVWSLVAFPIRPNADIAAMRPTSIYRRYCFLYVTPSQCCPSCSPSHSCNMLLPSLATGSRRL